MRYMARLGATGVRSLWRMELGKRPVVVATHLRTSSDVQRAEDVDRAYFAAKRYDETWLAPMARWAYLRRFLLRLVPKKNVYRILVRVLGPRHKLPNPNQLELAFPKPRPTHLWLVK